MTVGRIPGQISRTPRVSVEHNATLVMTDGTELSVTITDVSSGGFHLLTDETLPIGERVRLRVDRYGDFSAQIRWALGFEAGGVFLDTADPPTF